MNWGGVFTKQGGNFILNRWIFPLWSVWAVFFYIYSILILTCAGVITSLALVLILFLPIGAFEWWATGYFADLHPLPGAAYPPKKRILLWICNMALWALFYAVFEVYVFLKLPEAVGFRFYNSHFLPFTVLLWRSVMGFAWAALGYWILLYYLLTVRMGRLRIMAVLFLPVGITVAIFIVQWNIGGVGAVSDQTILSQPGVTKALGLEEISRTLIRDYPDKHNYLVPPASGQKTRGKILASNKEREVFYDQDRNALFAFYGGTYYTYGTTTIPAIVKKDLATGEITYLLTEHNVRRVEMTKNSFFVAPWHDNHLYEINKDDLSILRAIPVGTFISPMLWEPMDMALDAAGDKLYIVTSMYPSMVTVDLKTNRQTGVLPFFDPVSIGEGGVAWCMSQSRKTRLLYMVVVSDKMRNVVEVDPDRQQVLRTLEWDWNGLSAMILNPQEDALYCQSSMWDELTKVRPDTLSIERTYRGDRHARCLTLDPNRNVIYILGYCSGKVSSINLDTGKKSWELRVGGRPHGMYLDSQDRLWVHSMSGVYCLDLATIWKNREPAGTPSSPP